VDFVGVGARDTIRQIVNNKQVGGSGGEGRGGERMLGRSSEDSARVHETPSDE